MKSRAVAILGMHRCGTSMAARIVNLLGAYLGRKEDLMGPAYDNEAGFWERWDLMEFHDKALQSMGRTWDDPSPMPDWGALSQARSLERELIAKIEDVFTGQPLWAFKDPRACLLLPLWKNALSALNIDWQIVAAVRNPVDSIGSLARRNEYSWEKCCALWELHYRQVLDHIRETPHVIVLFEELCNAPAVQIAKLASALEIDVDEKALENAARSIRPDLIHNHSKEKYRLPAQVEETYGRLRKKALSLK
ncbi:sulfotransferase family protein [Desulfatibacillum aliphaticivorans]|uniref:sulfotransferase family protein n=1 Tax=Desulfatibacillum aliphaticivorans TaxID=218208 RepID=UPI000416F431|nr:sulfotransferase [Desulfatibacillum aliphaticivorans]